MFVNLGVFKRMMKESWKTTGLYVGRKGQRIVISGGYWTIRVDRVLLKKTDLAAIVEFAGELPEDGKAVTAMQKMDNEDGDYNDTNLQLLIGSIYDGKGIDFNPTKVVYLYGDKAVRVIQEPDLKRCVIVNEEIMHLIDKSRIDKEKEGYPSGPLAPDKRDEVMVWTNGRMDLIVRTALPSEKYREEVENFLQLLENMELERMEG